MNKISFFRFFLSWALLMQALTPVRADNINLPDLGDESLVAMSIAQEKRVGAEFMRQVRNSGGQADDPEYTDYLQSLGQRLLTQAETPYRDFHFFMVDEKEINAFAVPGGYVGVNKGLVLATRSEAELASVLAHEITHVTQRHVPRLIVESQRVNVPAMAAILAAIFLGGGHAAAGVAVTSAAVAQHEINFTRTFEEEADRLGMSLLARSGFDPGAMPAFFERMQVLNRVNDVNLPAFLRDHPVTSDRIAEARARADQLPARESRNSDDYLHVHAKLRALASGDDNEILNEFRQNLAQDRYRDANAEHYGYAVALLRHRDYAAAREEMSKLIARKPDRVYYRILQARIEMEAKQVKTALDQFARAYKQTPEHPALARYYSEALLAAKETERAYKILKTAVRKTTDDPTLYRLLGQAAGNSGHDVDARKASAEQYYLNGDFLAAIDQLERARKLVCDDYYLRSGIQARISEIRDEMQVFSGQENKPIQKDGQAEDSTRKHGDARDKDGCNQPDEKLKPPAQKDAKPAAK